jgi:hypothetical protein
MSKHITDTRLAEVAQIVAAPKVPHKVDRTFELPTGLYLLTAAAYLAFIGLMAAVFLNAGLAIPMVVFVVFIVMAFGVPAMWTRLGDDDGARRLSWSNFQSKGVMTLDGPITAGAATAQVLILPVAIVIWGLAIALIVALQ